MIVSSVNLSCGFCTEVGGGGTVSGTEAPPTLSPVGHLVVAVYLGFIGTVGLLSNLLVVTLFCRYRALRTPMNLLLLSISFSDLLVSVFGTPFSFAASTQGRWLLGRTGCVWYGFINACLGIVSLISLAVLSYERYCTIMAPTMADNKNFRPTFVGICFTWLYSAFWTTPPLLGWSRYGPEGPGTTCSVDWRTQTTNNISYIICLFIFCLVLPFLVILYSYGKLLLAIRQVRTVSVAVTRRREQRVLLMVVMMVVCYLICWLPYGVMALLSTFGPRDLLSPEVTITPSLLAKFSTVINPFIYVFMNKQFYRCFRAFFSCSKPELDGTSKTLSRLTKTLRTVRQDKEQHRSAALPSSPLHTHDSLHDALKGANQITPSPANAAPPAAHSLKPKLILVAHYRE